MKTLPKMVLLALLISSPAFAQTLINYGDSWKYHIPATDPGTAWRGVGFDDSTWSAGPGLLGFETSALPSPGKQTNVGSANGQMVYHFRKSFSYTGDPTGKMAVLDHIIDDGVSYYLNGKLWGSARHTPGGAWNDAAHSNVDNGIEELGVLRIPASKLIQGTNVLCAEVHQSVPNSSDMIFGARLSLANAPAPTVNANIQYVIYISVDGLRGHFIQQFIETAPTEFPNFTWLRDNAAHTFNARCDYSHSITIPNHTSMITGRPVSQPAGMPNTVHHGYTENLDTTGHNLHNPTQDPAQGISNFNVPYKASIFDVVHDSGRSTAMYADKVKFTFWNMSFNADSGAADITGVDNGKDKIDFANIVENNPTTIVNSLVSHISGNLESYTFFHFGMCDHAGHANGWSSAVNSPYRNAVKSVDTYLGQIFSAIAANPNLKDKVAIILSADHGGGGPSAFNSHVTPTEVENYTIPFFIYGPGFVPGSDVHSYFENRFDPGTGRPDYNAARQPIRNGDSANLCAALLGLPTVPGSLMKPELKRPVEANLSGGGISISWPAYLTGHVLEYKNDLTSGNPWAPVSTGITEINGVKSYQHTPATPSRFFRLNKGG